MYREPGGKTTADDCLHDGAVSPDAGAQLERGTKPNDDCPVGRPAAVQGVRSRKTWVVQSGCVCPARPGLKLPRAASLAPERGWQPPKAARMIVEVDTMSETRALHQTATPWHPRRLDRELYVLVIDEDLVVCGQAAETLARMGHVAVARTDWREAIGDARRHVFDAVFVQAATAEEGIRVMTALRRLQPRAHFVVMTEPVEGALSVAWRDYGAAMELAKPFSLLDLADTTRLILAEVASRPRPNSLARF